MDVDNPGRWIRIHRKQIRIDRKHRDTYLHKCRIFRIEDGQLTATHMAVPGQVQVAASASAACAKRSDLTDSDIGL